MILSLKIFRLLLETEVINILSRFITNFGRKILIIFYYKFYFFSTVQEIINTNRHGVDARLVHGSCIR